MTRSKRTTKSGNPESHLALYRATGRTAMNYYEEPRRKNTCLTDEFPIAFLSKFFCFHRSSGCSDRGCTRLRRQLRKAEADPLSFCEPQIQLSAFVSSQLTEKFSLPFDLDDQLLKLSKVLCRPSFEYNYSGLVLFMCCGSE